MLFEKLIAVIPLTRANPEPAEITQPIAQATLGGFQVLWHPAILSRSATLPVWSPAAEPPLAVPGQLIVVPEPSRQILPYGWEEQASAAGATVIAGDQARAPILARMFDKLPEEVGSAASHVEPDGFFALGLASLYLEMLTAYMHHSSTLDQEHLQKEVLAAATAAVVGDLATRDDHLRAAFQIISESRERLYGADIYLLDLCLLDPRAGLNRLAEQLRWQLPVSLFASGRTIEQLQARDAATTDALRRMLDESKAEVIGGEYEEVASILLPLESHLWQFRRGHDSYQNVLRRVPVVFGRRRFGLARHLLQLLNRLEFLFLTHFSFDDGVFPVKPDPKVRWEAADSSTVESLARIPFAADNAADFLRFPWRLARTIASDFVATLSLVHWPMPEAPWYRELLIMSRFANVFGKMATLSHYFQSTDAASISSALSNDDYASPFLVHDHRSGSATPVSDYPARHRLRARLEQIRWMIAAAQAIGPHATEESARSLEEVESALEQNDPSSTDGLATTEAMAKERLAKLVCSEDTLGGPGMLLFNPLGFDRRVVIAVDEQVAAVDSLPYAQASTDNSRCWVSHTIPGMGFAWVSSELANSAGDRPAASVEDQTIRNEFLEVEVEPVTGGLRSVRDRTSRFSQLGQKLVLVGIRGGGSADRGPASDDSTPVDFRSEPVKSEMRARSLSIKSTGPELACLEVEGDLVAKPCPAWASDPVLARFRQIYRLGRGQNMLRVEVEITELMPGTLDSRADPWQSYLASRFAWPDPRALLTRGVGTLVESTRSLRPESAYFIEVHGRRQRVVIVTGGLPFHQRIGQRMLDTLLITSSEQCRRFEFGIGMDLANPFQAALDLVTPPAMIARRGPPPSGSAAWIFHLDARNIVVTSMGSLAAGRRGVRFRLFESAGRYTRAHLRCPRNIAEARLTDFHGQRLATLDVQGDTVKLDLAPREITQLEIEFAVV